MQMFQWIISDDTSSLWHHRQRWSRFLLFITNIINQTENSNAKKSKLHIGYFVPETVCVLYGLLIATCLFLSSNLTVSSIIRTLYVFYGLLIATCLFISSRLTVRIIRNFNSSLLHSLKKNSSLLHCQHIFKNIFSVCYQSTTLLRRPQNWHHVSPASLCWLAVERTTRCGLRGMDIPHNYSTKTHSITLHPSDRHSLLIFLYIFLPYISNIYFTYLKSIIYKRSIFLLCCL
jgi:hypothetical protein